MSNNSYRKFLYQISARWLNDARWYKKMLTLYGDNQFYKNGMRFSALAWKNAYLKLIEE